MSFVIPAACVPQLGLQASDLLLELVSLVFTLHSLLLYAEEQLKWKTMSVSLRSNERNFLRY